MSDRAMQAVSPPLLATLCAPTDGVDPDPARAAALLRESGIEHCELRTVDGQEALDLPLSRRRALGAQLQQAGLQVALLSTSIGLAPAAEPIAPQCERLQQALELAVSLRAPCVQVYSLAVAPSELDERRPEAIERITRFAELAAQAGVTLLVENRPGTYACTGKRLGDLIRAAGSPALGVAFDPAGFAALKEHPFLSAFTGGPKRQVRCLRLRDATLENGAPVPLGEGNGEVKEIISALMARCYDGFFCLDPGPGATPAGFRAAFASYRTLMESLL